MQPVESVGHFAATGGFTHQGFEAQNFQHHPFWFFAGEVGGRQHVMAGATSKTLALLLISGPAKIGEQCKHQDGENENCHHGEPNLHGAQCRPAR